MVENGPKKSAPECPVECRGGGPIAIWAMPKCRGALIQKDTDMVDIFMSQALLAQFDLVLIVKCFVCNFCFMQVIQILAPW